MGYALAPNEMLLKLKHFYKAMAAAGRYNEYQHINASFDGQIVAQKSGYDLASPDKYAAMNAYQKIVSDNKTVVNANSVVKESTAGRILSEPAERKEKTSKADNKQEDVPKQEAPLKVAEPTPEKQPEKIPEKKPEIKEEKVPKAVMPKIENN
jgi:outer membrane biosynthesis protein TonB